MSEHSEPKDKGTDETGKRPYRSPHLAIYGDLSRLAMGQSVKQGTGGDGKNVPATKLG
jgi:hypothetical protein